MAVASLDEIESDFDDVQDSEDERMMQSYRFFLDNEVLFSPDGTCEHHHR